MASATASAAIPFPLLAAFGSLSFGLLRCRLVLSCSSDVDGLSLVLDSPVKEGKESGPFWGAEMSAICSLLSGWPLASAAASDLNGNDASCFVTPFADSKDFAGFLTGCPGCGRVGDSALVVRLAGLCADGCGAAEVAATSGCGSCGDAGLEDAAPSLF